MKKFIFFLTSITILGISIPAYAKFEQWEFDCMVDEMTDTKGCNVARILTTTDDNPRLILFIPAESGEDEGLIIHPEGICTGGMVRVDNHPAESILPHNDYCVFLWPRNGVFTEQLRNGETLKIRVETYRNETNTYNVSLSGIKESLQKMDEYRSSLGKK